MSIGPLSGFTVGVTADRRAGEQAQLLGRSGAEVVVGPCIRTLSSTGDPGLGAATTQLIAEPPDVVVLSTAIGVRGWFTEADALALGEPLHAAMGGAQVLARGPKAAGAALAGGLPVDWIAPDGTHRGVLEHLRRLVAGTSGADQPLRVALQLDGEPDSPLPERIRDLGCDVVAVPVYEWRRPDDIVPAKRLVAAVADRSVDAVTFTAAPTVEHFASVAEDLGVLDAVISAVRDGRVTVMCVGPVTAAAARSVGFDACGRPVRPTLGAMLHALSSALVDRVVRVPVGGSQLVLQGRLVLADDGVAVRLTDRERAVLEELARSPGAVVSKRLLNETVWAGEADDHVVEVTIGRLRRRLGAAGRGIETVVRRGYRLASA